jgi:hypothetical protein
MAVLDRDSRETHPGRQLLPDQIVQAGVARDRVVEARDRAEEALDRAEARDRGEEALDREAEVMALPEDTALAQGAPAIVCPARLLSCSAHSIRRPTVPTIKRPWIPVIQPWVLAPPQ